MAGNKFASGSSNAAPARAHPFATATDTQSMAAVRIAQPHHETADTYQGVIAHLNPAWRVITCKDGIQWVLQRRDAARSGQPRWIGVRYCLTRNALINASRALCDPIDPTVLSVLEALPARKGGAA